MRLCFNKGTPTQKQTKPFKRYTDTNTLTHSLTEYITAIPNQKEHTEIEKLLGESLAQALRCLMIRTASFENELEQFFHPCQAVPVSAVMDLRRWIQAHWKKVV